MTRRTSGTRPGPEITRFNLHPNMPCRRNRVSGWLVSRINNRVFVVRMVLRYIQVLQARTTKFRIMFEPPDEIMSGNDNENRFGPLHPGSLRDYTEFSDNWVLLKNAIGSCGNTSVNRLLTGRPHGASDRVRH